MWETLPPRRGHPIRSTAVRFLLLLAVWSIPVLLPTFAGHRSEWLLFLLVVAAISSLIAIPLRWLQKRMTAPGRTRVGNQIARAVVGLIACCIAAVVLFHYVRFPSDTVFFLVAIPTLLTVWLAFHNWRTLFRATADKLHWSALTCSMIGFSILAAGFALQRFLDRRYADVAMFICFLAALGCLATRLPSESQTPE